HYMEQGTPEWDAVRAGKITASVASKMVTPTGKPSTQAKPYIGCLIAEQMKLQKPEPIPPSDWMERGTELENEARGWFQVETGQRVHQCGFIEQDELCGFSPDGYIGGKVIIPLELKVPKPSTHIGHLIESELPKTYKAQCHFAMVITGAPYMYFMSYNPGIKPLLLKVERDDYTVCVENALVKCKADLIKAKEILK
ncbi:MAG: YqaJ viral recombinase family protein, partial [Gammaproteobacteria bacterium]|nr:YqaJ viral recombinase family protein [Gammaproteobacteria bacterium]